MQSKILIIGILFLLACKGEGVKSVSVQGSYVSNYESHYSKAMDTIELTPINEHTGTFQYVRRTGYRRIFNGTPGPYQHTTENSTCVFDEKTAQLNEQRHGRVYSLSGDGNQLVSGNSVYKRIQ